jgi:DNA-binding NarL/FixJ family response regulator
MKKIKILIVEDNRLLREGIAAMIKEQPDMNAADALGSYESISGKIRLVKPKIVLLDLGLSDKNSLHLVRSFKRDFPETKVIVMDLIPTHTDILEFIQAGVQGFILKDATIAEFLRTIRSVAGGAKVLPNHLTGSLFSQIIENAVNNDKISKLKELVKMTKRERQVIELIADGLTNKEIAEQLHLSTFTVKSHVHNILEKLALRTRVQIAKYSHDNKDFNETVNKISLIEE